MANIEKRSKALSVSPLKSSQTIGAALAFLGIHRAMPMLHGSQGCTAFGKVFFVRHFREPIPLQTSAMDQVSAVMGADDNVTEGLKTICEKSSPALVGVPTTGLAETQGCDVKRAIYTFREKYPEYNHIPVVPVATPDYTGCMETGYAAAVAAIIDELVPLAEEAGTQPGQRKKQVTVLAGSHLTPGDLELIKDMIEMFGLRPVLIPDLSDSLDGRLTDSDFSPLTIGGTTVDNSVPWACHWRPWPSVRLCIKLQIYCTNAPVCRIGVSIISWSWMRWMNSSRHWRRFPANRCRINWNGVALSYRTPCWTPILCSA